MKVKGASGDSQATTERLITHIIRQTGAGGEKEKFFFDNRSLFPRSDDDRARDERIFPIRTSGMIKYEQQGGKVDLKLKAGGGMIDRFVLRAIVHRPRDVKRLVHQLPASLTRDTAHHSLIVISRVAGETSNTRNYLGSWFEAKKSPVSNQIRKTIRLNE